MEYKEIQELIKLISRYNLAEFKMKDGDFEIAVRTDKYAKTSGTPTVIQSTPVMAQPAAVPAVSQTSQPAAQAPAQSGGKAEKPADDQLIYIKSPMVGTFYRSPSPDKAPYIKVGDTVNQGHVVCIVEAMKLFNEIESEVSGKVVQILVEDASPVEYDQPLFAVEPA